MTQRMVMCAKLKKEMPGLEKPPFGGDIGEKIFNQVSAEVWNSWRNDMQIKVLNEYRLNMGDPKDYQVMVNQMLLFLGLASGESMKVNDK
jgi:Fe-S cluster biosynthesis and repair protein YggX